MNYNVQMTVILKMLMMNMLMKMMRMWVRKCGQFYTEHVI